MDRVRARLYRTGLNSQRSSKPFFLRIPNAYAVLQPNFRGSTGYGQAFVNAGVGEWGQKMQTDLSDGVRYLAQQGIIDPARVAIAGASYGGYAALAGAALDTGIYRCAVSISGLSDVKSWMKWELEEQNGRKSAYSVRYWKAFLGDPKRWDAISPARNIDRISIPVLLIHGTDDDVVPIQQSELMRDAMTRAGKSVQFISLPDEDHWLSREPTRIKALEALVSFIETHNPI